MSLTIPCKWRHPYGVLSGLTATILGLTLGACDTCESWSIDRTYEVATDCGGERTFRVRVYGEVDNSGGEWRGQTIGTETDPPTLIGATPTDTCDDGSFLFLLGSPDVAEAVEYECADVPVEGGSVSCHRLEIDHMDYDACTTSFTLVDG